MGMAMDFDITAAPARTLLLVDDEPSILSSLQRLLRKDGFRILTAQNGLAALEILADQEVGVVVSDGLMEGMTGAEFLHEVKIRFPRTVRILLTGFTDPEVVMAAIKNCQLYKFLPKPWDDDEVRQTLKAAFEFFESAHHDVV